VYLAQAILFTLPMKLNFIILLGFLFIQCKNKNSDQATLIPLEDSIQYFNNFLSKNPNADSIWFQQGLYFLKHEQVDTGIMSLEKALQLNMQYLPYYLSLSDAYLLGIESRKAEEILDTAMILFPDNIELWLKKARLQLVLNKHLNALASLDYIFSLDPQNEDANYLAGHVFYEQGDTARAIRCYQKTVDLNPDYINAWIQLGDIMLALKNRRSIDYYRNAIRLDSNNIETLHNYAYALQSLNKIEEAKEQYKCNIAKEPNYELSYYNLGVIYQKSDSCNQAIEYLSKAILINEKEASSYYHRANCYLKLGSKIKAAEDLKQALRLVPEYKEAKELLGKLN
jgi:tetratricopeptide (TPR) repeat protein